MNSGSLRALVCGALLSATMLAGSTAALAQSTFTAPDRAYKGEIAFGGATERAPIHAGQDVTVSGEGFRAGQPVTLMYGSTVLTSGPLTADAKGEVKGRFTLPADAAVGTHPITVLTQAPYHAAVAELKVSPNIPLSGAERFQLHAAPVAEGLYQSAYSKRNDALFVTGAVGRPPVHKSELLRLDPRTLAVVARVTPAAAPARAPRPGAPAGASTDAGVFAVYGVGVDDANGNVWVTNTRQNSVAVYRQSDLKLVKQFDPGVVDHGRDIVVDQELGKAYASAVSAPKVAVFDTAGLTLSKQIDVASKQRGKDFAGTSLSLDPVNHKLYVAGLSTNEVAVIDTRTDAVENVFAVPGANGAIGVSHDPATGRIFVVAQGSDNLVILDGKSGAVLSDTPVGAGPLNVVYDPVSKLAYVSNYAGGTITVVAPDGKIAANLGPAPVANHVAIDGKGTVFAVNKSSRNGGGNDTVRRISIKRR